MRCLAWLPWTICLSIAFSPIEAQGANEQWVSRYDGPVDGGTDAAYAIAVDSVGNVIVTGSSALEIGGHYNFYTAKYHASTGALLWEKRYNGPAVGFDRGTAVALDGAGNVLVTGF